jgi:hypothetical protein
MFKKMCLVLLLAVVACGGAFAFDATSLPGCIESGNILVSPMFKIGTGYWTGSAISIGAAVEYALGLPLLVGGEAGFVMLTGTDVKSIPILGRVSYHPNFEVENLDVYLTLKIGYNILLSGFDYGYSGESWSGGISYGGNVGCRYFFNDTMAVLGELGYDNYAISWDYKYSYGMYSYSYSGKGYLNTYFTLGISFKL